MRLTSLLIILLLTSCSNQFAYETSNWVMVTKTASEESFKTAYIDTNRLDCKDGKCKVWTKLLFGNEEAVEYGGSKEGQVSGSLSVKRVDSSVEYDCQNRLATIISYQLYDAHDKMIDSKWIKSEPEYIQPGTIHDDILKFVCKSKDT